MDEFLDKYHSSNKIQNKGKTDRFANKIYEKNKVNEFLEKYAPSRHKKRNIICKINLQKKEIYFPQKNGKIKKYSLKDFPVKNQKY